VFKKTKLSKLKKLKNLSLLHDYYFGVTISHTKIILRRKKSIALLFICAHFIWGLQLGLGLS